MKTTLLKLLIASTLSCFAVSAQAVENYIPSESNLEARKEFQDNKFGIFLHWGIYSMPAQGEWYMHNKNINRDEYAKLASGFYPSKFNAKEWVSAVKGAGAKYICITSRHHDGFSMFKTNWSDFNIVDATPYGRDVLKELADECQKQGIKIHFYYSHLDWRRDDYPQGRTGKGTGRKEGHGDWESYYCFMNNQLTELLSNYGPVGAIWFDGAWDQPKEFNWELTEQYELIHTLQPACLIGNNHHRTPYPGEDIQIFERDLPGENTAGYSAGQSVSALPLETCETMNGMWGYKIEDQDYKSSEILIRYLVKAAGKNANLLLNIGPQPNGELPAPAVERLKEIGKWLDTYGDTIYGTRGGDVPPQDWGCSTRKGNRLFIHILDFQNKELSIPLSAKVSRVEEFQSKKPVEFRQDEKGIHLTLPKVPDETDYILELTLDK